VSTRKALAVAGSCVKHVYGHGIVEAASKMALAKELNLSS